MSSNLHRHHVLAGYREILKLIKRLPAAQQNAVYDEVRQNMRRHTQEADPASQLDLMKRLTAKISFLRTITPRKPGDKSSTLGTGTYVIRDGKLVQGTGQGMGKRVADGTMSMSEAYERHHQLLKRQHFGRDPPAYKPSSF